MFKENSSKKSQAQSNSTAKKRRVTFSMQAGTANQVLLAGDFNQWSLKTHPMKKDDKGIWNRTLMLHPGNYEYKFIIDGQWHQDPENECTCPNCYGTLNSILRV